jgi:hypothetical protein
MPSWSLIDFKGFFSFRGENCGCTPAEASRPAAEIAGRLRLWQKCINAPCGDFGRINAPLDI